MLLLVGRLLGNLGVVLLMERKGERVVLCVAGFIAELDLDCFRAGVVAVVGCLPAWMLALWLLSLPTLTLPMHPLMV